MFGGGEVRRGALLALLVWLVLTALKWLGTASAGAASAGDAAVAVRQAALIRAAGQRPIALGGAAVAGRVSNADGGAHSAACIYAGKLVDSVRTKLVSARYCL